MSVEVETKISPQEQLPAQELALRPAGRRANEVGLRGLRALRLRRRGWVAKHREAGMATAEYAIAMIAAAGFAGLLIVILKSGPVRDLLTSIVETALGTR